MTLLGGGAQHGLLPVGALAECTDFSVAVSGLVAEIVFLQLCPLGGAEQVQLLADAACTDVIGIADVRLVLAGFALPGGYQNHAVGSARAIDGRGRHVFQHLHALNVVGVDGCQRIQSAGQPAQSGAAVGSILEIDEAVDYIEGFVRSVHRVASTDAYLTFSSGLSAGCRHVQSGHLSAQGTVQRGCLRLAEHVGPDRRNAARQLGTSLCAVAHHHYFREMACVFLQADVDQRVASDDAHPLVLVAHVAHADLRGEGGDVQLEMSLGVGHGSHLIIIDDGCSDDSLTRLGIGHIPVDRGGRCLRQRYG